MTLSLSHADLAALHKASFTLPRPWSETEFAGLLSMADVFLTCGDGPSFALGRVVAGEAELLTLAVDPNAQGRGLGRVALEAYEVEARRRGADISFLEVATTNTVAIKLYLSHGYAESGRRRAYYAAPDGTKIDAFVFSKPFERA
ncbi:GNAT family N-acetyltransferase [Pacificibacter marinus]|uniref:GNAT family N-acetyltransferase n=1 Tax=Pacificibacter marinus TaxID=658057 RepID=UPI001C075F3B|nr:GNAT family N-acetyltransferase [Pacificibacter marinus]MBU2868785.1 GNAT family N-acetyltransferase [Pacificibacter marinus]